ncbi:uncharacterized protein LOC119096888 [Pollicipes pollicipes]|uniref:uncharacterized protein LOC119096888 n=1 Tax=Pollicipes pollicipes TaxID=41117 RepID=UPI0018856587|nr:uncharacterized protein LOC119096888 [Pollicipes pollicipes]
MRFSGDPAAAAILAETRQLNADGSSDVAYAQEDGVLFKETTSKDGERRGSYEYVGDDNKKYRVEYVGRRRRLPDREQHARGQDAGPAPLGAAVGASTAAGRQPAGACQHQHLQHQLRPEPADGGAGRLRAGHGRHDNDHDDDAPPRPQELPHRQGVAGAQRQGLRLQLHPQRLSASLSHSLPLSLSTTRCRRSSPGWAPRLRRCRGRPLRSAPGRPRRGGAASNANGVAQRFAALFVRGRHDLLSGGVQSLPLWRSAESRAACVVATPVQCFLSSAQYCIAADAPCCLSACGMLLLLSLSLS